MKVNVILWDRPSALSLNHVNAFVNLWYLLLGCLICLFVSTSDWFRLQRIVGDLFKKKGINERLIGFAIQKLINHYPKRDLRDLLLHLSLKEESINFIVTIIVTVQLIWEFKASTDLLSQNGLWWCCTGMRWNEIQVVPYKCSLLKINWWVFRNSWKLCNDSLSDKSDAVARTSRWVSFLVPPYVVLIADNELFDFATLHSFLL